MGWKSAALAAWATGQAAAAGAAQKFQHMVSLLRTIQVLLLVALFTLLGTILVSLAQPAWTPYAYSIGAIVLAVPLVAVLVLVWKPLHSKSLHKAERWARAAPRRPDREAILQRELEEAHRELRRLRRA